MAVYIRMAGGQGEVFWVFFRPCINPGRFLYELVGMCIVCLVPLAISGSVAIGSYCTQPRAFVFADKQNSLDWNFLLLRYRQK